MNNDKKIEFDLLKYLLNNEKNPGMISQRDIAKTLGISLGMTNEVLKKAIVKGLVLAKKINSKNFHYILTAKGMDVFTRKAVNFTKSIFINVYKYNRFIESYLDDLKQKGFQAVILIGSSSVDFILEFYAVNKKMDFFYFPSNKIESDLQKIKKLINKYKNNFKGNENFCGSDEINCNSKIFIFYGESLEEKKVEELEHLVNFPELTTMDSNDGNNFQNNEVRRSEGDTTSMDDGVSAKRKNKDEMNKDGINTNKVETDYPGKISVSQIIKEVIQNNEELTDDSVQYTITTDDDSVKYDSV